MPSEPPSKERDKIYVASSDGPRYTVKTSELVIIPGRAKRAFAEAANAGRTGARLYRWALGVLARYHEQLPRPADDTVLECIRNLWPTDPIPGGKARENLLRARMRAGGHRYDRAQVNRVILRHGIATIGRGRPHRQ